MMDDQFFSSCIIPSTSITMDQPLDAPICNITHLCMAHSTGVPLSTVVGVVSCGCDSRECNGTWAQMHSTFVQDPSCI